VRWEFSWLIAFRLILFFKILRLLIRILIKRPVEKHDDAEQDEPRNMSKFLVVNVPEAEFVEEQERKTEDKFTKS
jgi:hypothetical protein